MPDSWKAYNKAPEDAAQGLESLVDDESISEEDVVKKFDAITKKGKIPSFWKVWTTDFKSTDKMTGIAISENLMNKFEICFKKPKTKIIKTEKNFTNFQFLLVLFSFFTSSAWPFSLI